MPYAYAQQGDYKTYGYAGDPGFLSSLWKGVKKVGKFIPGPIGTAFRVAAGISAGGIALSALGGKPPMRTTDPIYGGMPPSPAGQMTRFTPGITGPAPIVPLGPGYAGAPMDGCCPTGYHLRKDKRLPAKCVRNRRMNVGNAKALRRGMRRVQGFEKLARRTITFTRRTKLKTRKT